MTINELIQVAHSDARANGWWAEERNTGELLMLIVSECGEALEAHRSGKRANLAMYDQLMISVQSKEINVTESDLFKDHIKDTFEDELADIVIRIADACGSYPKCIEWMQADDGLYAEDYDGPDGSFNVGEQLMSVVQMLVHSGFGDHMRRPEKVGEYFGSAMREVFSIAQFMNIDIDRHIELKLAFNRTRPKKHGKAY